MMKSEKDGLTIIKFFWTIWAGTACVQLPNNACKESLETIAFVSKCPSNTQEYMEAALRKNCTQRTQACRSFEYHCVLNERMSKLVEVCAPSRFILSGKCTEFNVGLQSIRKSYTADCTNFNNPCPTSYNSTKSYLYTGCYEMITTTTMSTAETTTKNSTNCTVTEDDGRQVGQRSRKIMVLEKSEIIAISLSLTVLVITVGIGIVLHRLRQKQKGNIRGAEGKRYTEVQQNTEMENRM